MLQHLIVHFLLFYLANGRLWEVKTIENNFKLLELSKSGCGRLQEVVAHKRFQMYTLGARGFFSLGATELSGEATKASREAARKKPLAPTDNNLTSIPTPISFDWHSQS